MNKFLRKTANLDTASYKKWLDGLGLQALKRERANMVDLTNERPSSPLIDDNGNYRIMNPATRLTLHQNVTSMTPSMQKAFVKLLDRENTSALGMIEDTIEDKRPWTDKLKQTLSEALGL